MATSSLLRDIKIKDKRLARNLVEALEESCEEQDKKVIMTKSVKELKKESIKAIFKR